MTSRPYVETLVFVGGISADVRSLVHEHPDLVAPVAWGMDGTLGAGGRAAIAAVGAVRLGRRFVDLVGCVGDDLLGDGILASLKEGGLSTRLVDRVEGTATGIRQLVEDSKGARLVVGVANANRRVGETQLRKADSTIFGADLLFVTLEVPMATVRKVVAMAASRNVPVVLDATPVPTAAGETEIDSHVLRHVDVLLTNWNGAGHLAAMPSSVGPTGIELSRRLLGLGPKAVIITLGEHGSLVAIRGKHALIEPVHVRAIDTTAAGDAYAAALAVGLTDQSRGNYRWEQLVRAAQYASAAAAACVATSGGYESLPSRAEVERLLDGD